MTTNDSVAARAQSSAQLLGWLTALTGLTSIIAVVVLVLTGHSAAGTAVAVIGGGVSAVGGIRVTVNIRR
ncbi:hypothetical protein ABZS93_08805 [Streptomyces sp900116325]|uniref:hypothetical protein n=1 Tax=Streptomyces sp. 900116325 TaxID=3154295 RepID=UPI0033B61591